MAALFADRVHAGQVLAQHLGGYRDDAAVVVGLPRGGVPVAAVVAETLKAPLEVCVVRKVGAPRHPELAMGAVAEEGISVTEPWVVRQAQLSEAELRDAFAAKHAEVNERIRLFRGDRPPLEVRGKTVIVVDDGLATGSTARAAIASLRQRGAQRVVLAVPVASADALEALRSDVDEVVCPHALADFWAVGMWYDDFRPTTDQEVIDLLTRMAS